MEKLLLKYQDVIIENLNKKQIQMLQRALRAFKYGYDTNITDKMVQIVYEMLIADNYWMIECKEKISRKCQKCREKRTENV